MRNFSLMPSMRLPCRILNTFRFAEVLAALERKTFICKKMGFTYRLWLWFKVGGFNAWGLGIVGSSLHSRSKRTPGLVFGSDWLQLRVLALLYQP